MAESSLFWDGVTTGDHGPYDDADLCDTFFSAIWGSLGNQGVLRGWGNELAVTHVAGLTVSVASGAALAHGGWYENTAAQTLTGMADGDYIVIRRCFQADPGPPIGIAANSARLTFKAALVQDAALLTYWDIPLAQVTVAGGAVTAIADLREFCEFSTEYLDYSVNEGAIQDNSMTVDKFEDQIRWITRGVGEMQGDSSTPMTLTHLGNTAVAWYDHVPFRQVWQAPGTVWVTFRVPEDIVCDSLYGPSTMDIYLWLTYYSFDIVSGESADTAWTINAWIGDDTELFDVQTLTKTFAKNSLAHTYTVLEDYSISTILGVGATAVVSGGVLYVARDHDITKRFATPMLIGSLDVYHGDVVHLEITESGSGAYNYMLLSMVEARYTAES